MRFFFPEIWRGKGKNWIFYYIFLNKDISKTVKDIYMKFYMVRLHTYSEGSVSQICCLGPSFYFMLFRKEYFKSSPKFTRFMI